MPELPDVEHYRRILAAGGLHRKIAAVSVNDRRILESVTPRRLANRLTGAALVKTRRRGKHLLVRYSGGGWLTMHFGMTGVLAVIPRGEEMPRFTRVRLEFKDGGHLAYISRRMLGRVGLTDDAEAFFREQGLGADALDSAFDRGAFVRLLSDLRRGAKSALMDQGVISGIGNIYSDEILFQARLHPDARLDALDNTTLARLYRAMRRVLQVAIKRGAGSEEFLDRLPRGYLLPRRGKGGRCPRCNAPLATHKSGGRTGWFCPHCQPEMGS